MKCAILCGGKGTRMGSLTEELPKPLLPIGEKPIVRRIMEHYARYGVSDFILCLGFQGGKIEDYLSKNPLNFKVEVSDCGENATKAQRLLAIRDWVGERFFVSYGDDIGDIDLSRLATHHTKEGKLATLTAVKIANPYGVLEMDEFEPSQIAGFREKPIMNEWINGGYFLFDRQIFDYIETGDELEKEVFAKLIRERQLTAYRHPGFWKSMNTSKDFIELNEMFNKGRLDSLFKEG